ncbi:MAG: hypothetical protein ACYDDG_14955 [Casimicrobiaceae bacterium]
MDTRSAVAELMAECPKCGAITTQVIKLAWRARMVTCTECLTSVPVDGDTLSTVRRQAADALATIDQLA